MSLTDEERDAVVQYRIEKSMKSFQEAEKVSEISLWNIAATGCIMLFSTFLRLF